MSDAHFWTCRKCGTQNYGFEHCQNCGASEHMGEYIITTEQLNFFMGYMPDDAMFPAKMAHLQPIVRCRECRFFHIWREPQGQICMRLKFEDGRDMSNGFCAWGERA